MVLLLLAATCLLFFMTQQSDSDIELIVDNRLNEIYSKYNLSVKDFGSWTGYPEENWSHDELSKEKSSKDRDITRVFQKNNSAIMERSIGGNIEKNIISFNYLTNRNESMKAIPKFVPKPISLNGKTIYALDALGMEDATRKTERDKGQDGDIQPKNLTIKAKKMEDPKENAQKKQLKNTINAGDNTRRKQVNQDENIKKKQESVESPDKNTERNGKNEDDQDGKANDGAIAKPKNTEIKLKQKSNETSHGEKPFMEGDSPKARKKSLKDKFGIGGGGGRIAKVTEKMQDTMIDKQGRELEKDLYNLAPEIFDFVPLEFENEIKSQCWMDDNEETWCLPYFYIIGMPDSGAENLYQKIGHHPAVAETIKMTHHWWSRGRARHKDDLLKSFQTYIRAGKNVIEAFRKQDFGMVYGDESTSVFWDNAQWWEAYFPGYEEAPPYTTADILGAVHPKAKLLLTLMEPSATVFQNYLITNWKTASPEDFDERCANSIDEYEECLETKSSRTCIYKPFNDKDKTMRLQWGFLSQYFEDWLKVFPLKQFHVVEKLKLEKSCLIELPKIYSFLGLKRLSMRKIREICQTESKILRALPPNSPKIQQSTKELLDSYYLPYFDKLEEVLQKY